jgi:hypothetical protein
MRLQTGVLVVLHGLVSSNIKNIVLNPRFIQCTSYNTVNCFKILAYIFE